MQREKNCSITVLYENSPEEIRHIADYFDQVDVVIILDNSKEDNESMVYEALDSNSSMESISSTTAIASATANGENKIIYQHFGENIGLCKALNIGMKKAFDIGCKWALLMDADSSITDDLVSLYGDYLTSMPAAEIAVLAPVHKYDRANTKGYSGTKNVRWAMTSGCYYNVDIFKQLGGFKEELFVDCLDLDYCYRVNRGGYRVVELGAASVQHHPGETKKVKIAGKELLGYGYASPWRYYMQARGIVWLILEYHSIPDCFRYLSKWVKVIFLFDNKKQYISNMKKGSKEGYQLWRMERHKK